MPRTYHYINRIQITTAFSQQTRWGIRISHYVWVQASLNNCLTNLSAQIGNLNFCADPQGQIVHQA
jgi:hypothetical protein